MSSIEANTGNTGNTRKRLPGGDIMIVMGDLNTKIASGNISLVYGLADRRLVQISSPHHW